MPHFNAELLLVINVETIDQADDLATYIAEDIVKVYGPPYASNGTVIASSVEAIAPKGSVT